MNPNDHSAGEIVRRIMPISQEAGDVPKGLVDDANDMGDYSTTLIRSQSNDDGLAVSQLDTFWTGSNPDAWVPVDVPPRLHDSDTPAKQNWNEQFSELMTSAESGNSMESGQSVADTALTNNGSELDEGAVSDTDSINSCASDYLFPGRAKLPAKKRGRGRPAENQAERGRRVEKGFEQLESFKKNRIELTYHSIEKCVRMLLRKPPKKPAKKKVPTSGQKRTKKEIPLKFQPKQLKFNDVIKSQKLFKEYCDERNTVFAHFAGKVADAKRDAARVKKKKEELDSVKLAYKRNMDEFEKGQNKLENILRPVMFHQDPWIQIAVDDFRELDGKVRSFKRTKFDRKVDPLSHPDYLAKHGTQVPENANVTRCRKRDETEKDFYDKRVPVLQDYRIELERIWNMHPCFKNALRTQEQAASQNALVPSISAAPSSPTPSMQDYNVPDMSIPH